MTAEKDAFDLWWEWATMPVGSMLTIPADIHNAVMALAPDERCDRAKVNEAVREGLELGPERPAGSADKYGVPKATEEAANDHHNFLILSEVIAQNADPPIGEMTLTTDQGDIVLVIDQEAAEDLIEQLTAFLDME